MAKAIKVPDVQAPTARLCWRQNELMIRCDRKAGHGGRCSWDLGDPDGEADTAMKADGFDAAIIGVTASQPGRQALVVYDLDRMIKILGRRDGLSEDDALEHLMFNTVGA